MGTRDECHVALVLAIVTMADCIGDGDGDGNGDGNGNGNGKLFIFILNLSGLSMVPEPVGTFLSLSFLLSPPWLRASVVNFSLFFIE